MITLTPKYANVSVMMAETYQAQDYYQTCYKYGMMNYGNKVPTDSLTPQQKWDYYQQVMAVGGALVKDNPAEFGVLSSRPTDRRENYVKRCVGLPGQTLQIKDKIVYLDGKANKEPDNVQYTYFVRLKQMIPDFYLL